MSLVSKSESQHTNKTHLGIKIYNLSGLGFLYKLIQNAKIGKTNMQIQNDIYVGRKQMKYIHVLILKIL